MKNLLSITLFFAIALIACNDEEATPQPDPLLGNEYFPLQVGNMWQLEYSSKREIIDSSLMNDKIYYLMVYNEDTSYYRIADSMVYVSEFDSTEAVKFKLSASVGETWEFNLWEVTLQSKTDVVEIGDEKIEACFHFSFDIPGMVDDEHSIWLAPGYGFIKYNCGFCPNPIRKLDKAIINGQIIDL